VTARPVAAPRGALWIALGLSLVGAVLSILLVRIHAQAHAGIASFCSISDVVNCDRVATSPYAVVLGLPVAAWGLLGYGLMAALSGAALWRGGASSVWMAGLLVVLGSFAVAVSVVLAVVSEAAIGALCLLCAGSWLVSVALLLAARWACRETGVGASVRQAAAALRASPGRTGAAVALGALVVAGAAMAYPRYWERARPAVRTAGTGEVGPSAPAALPSGPPVVVEYSDYECPFCARAHEEMRAILEKRPDVTVVRRQFPLDAACNPALTKSIHPSACTLARAGICAQAQGRFAEMDDALFRNQRDGRSPIELAQRIGLDLERFRSCVTSPETERRLQADIAAGIREGVRATPTYVVGQVARAGQFPLDLLPPPPPAPAAAPTPAQTAR
jgi:protein-disulfide isomerase